MTVSLGYALLLRDHWARCRLVMFWKLLTRWFKVKEHNLFWVLWKHLCFLKFIILSMWTCTVQYNVYSRTQHTTLCTENSFRKIPFTQALWFTKLFMVEFQHWYPTGVKFPAILACLLFFIFISLFFWFCFFRPHSVMFKVYFWLCTRVPWGPLWGAGGQTWSAPSVCCAVTLAQSASLTEVLLLQFVLRACSVFVFGWNIPRDWCTLDSRTLWFPQFLSFPDLSSFWGLGWSGYPPFNALHSLVLLL